MKPAKIISGGQTGADLGALRAGLALTIPTGGYMPRGFRNELGERPWMAKMYSMVEHASPQYQPRTRANVLDADLTLIFGETRSPGSKLTLSYVGGFKKPYLVNPDLEALVLAGIGIVGADPPRGRIVNVAGNRESVNPGLEAYVYRLLIDAWGTAEEIARLRPSAPWPIEWPTGVWVPCDGGEAREG